MKRLVALATVAAVLVVAFALAQEHKTEGKQEAAKPDHVMFTGMELAWKDAPPALPPGAKMAVLEGDPAQPALFTMRIKVPAGYKVPPHWHPADEHVTVISGSLFMGLGEKFDEKGMKELPPGGFAMMVTGTRHFAMAKKESEIQVHAMGPWGINYVNPADDPRQTKMDK
ncbi:MAG: cupin domain-containing protein [candidate division Zixibacteria bacterium]|nr:cupin domain-containing protein [candidate division Zixibacteria bacterium]